MLGRVAIAGRRAAYRAGVAGRMLTGDARPVAPIERAWVAVVGACRPVRLFLIGRAGGTAAGAVLGDVAGARGRTADAGRREQVVGRACRARAAAVLGDVTRAGRWPAGDGRRSKRIGGAGAARPGARLGDVAGACRGAAG